MTADNDDYALVAVWPDLAKPPCCTNYLTAPVSTVQAGIEAGEVDPHSMALNVLDHLERAGFVIGRRAHNAAVQA